MFCHRPMFKIRSLTSVLSILCCGTVLSSCGRLDPRWAATGMVDKLTAEADARKLHACGDFFIGPLSGHSWLLDHADRTNVMIYANGDMMFAYQLNAFTLPLTNSFPT